MYISKAELKLGDAQALLEQVKTFCSKHSLEYELFEADRKQSMRIWAAGGGALKVEDRIVGDKT